MGIVELGRALGCQSRMRVMALIETSGPLSITALAKRVGVGVSTMSYHVARLAETGLVLTKRRGRTVIVSPAWETLELVGTRAG